MNLGTDPEQTLEAAIRQKIAPLEPDLQTIVRMGRIALHVREIDDNHRISQVGMVILMEAPLKRAKQPSEGKNAPKPKLPKHPERTDPPDERSGSPT